MCLDRLDKRVVSAVVIVMFGGPGLPRSDEESKTGGEGARQSAIKGSSFDHKDEIVRGLPIEGVIPTREPIDLTIASYNVQTRPVFDKPDEKLPLISPLLNDYDVVLIQECFTRRDLLWSKAEFPNKVYFGRLAAKGKLANSGLSVLTKLPMGEVHSEHFRDVGELQNRVASKGILLVRMQAGGVPIDVYDTHMEAGDTLVAQKARHGQAKQVVEFVSKHSPADHAVILMGDFNMGPLRKGKPWRDYRPNHYSSEEDMMSRTAAYETMFGGLQLTDASDQLHGQTDDGIERLLYRTGSHCRIDILACAFENRRFRRPDGSSLSDGSPLIVKLRIRPVSSDQ